MTQENIFTAPATPDASKATPPATTVVPLELTEFVGTGKKYATVEDALKSVPHAQTHIQTIEQELKEAKEELNKRRTTEEILAELKATGTSSQGTPPTKAEITPEQIAQIVNNTLAQEQTKASQKTNVATVTTAFTEKFGDKAEAMFIKVAEESGVSVEDFNKLAKTSPAVILKLAGLDKPATKGIVTKITNDVNSQAFKAPQDETSARVTGTSTKDLVSAWNKAGAKIGKIV